MALRSYQDLIAWQKAMDLVVVVYQITQELLQEELYGLTSQVRRSIISVLSNIAEGQGRQTATEFQRFLAIAYGSLQEAETQIILAHRLPDIDKTEQQKVLASCAEVGRPINGLANSLTKYH